MEQIIRRKVLDLNTSLKVANGLKLMVIVKEWHEQAEIIQNYVIAHYDTKLKPVGGRGGSLDGTTLIDDFAGVTI